MLIKLKVHKGKKLKEPAITLWIQKQRDLKRELETIFQFFKDNIDVSNSWPFKRYFKVKSDNPAILLSFFSAVQEMIPDLYFSEPRSLSMKGAII